MGRPTTGTRSCVVEPPLSAGLWPYRDTKGRPMRGLLKGKKKEAEEVSEDAPEPEEEAA